MERGDLLPLLLMLPTLVVVFSVMVAPLLYGFTLSLFDVGFGKQISAKAFLGLSNYVKFLNDPIALKAVFNTVLFSAGAILGDLILGTLCAVFLLQVPRVLSSTLRPIVTMPLLVSPIVVGLTWRYIYDPKGILYWLMSLVGKGIENFPGVTSPSTALLSTVITQWWQVTPFVIIVVTAGLLAIPQELYEASKIDGAGPFTTFFRITLPQLTNVYIVILLISGVDTIKVFDIIYALTGGGPNNSSISLSIFAYSHAFEQSDLSYSMAISFMTMAITFIIFGIPFIRHNLGKGDRG